MAEQPVIAADTAETTIRPAVGLLALLGFRVPKLIPEQAALLATIKLPCC